MSTATRSPTTSASSIPQIFGFSRELSITDKIGLAPLRQRPHPIRLHLRVAHAANLIGLVVRFQRLRRRGEQRTVSIDIPLGGGPQRPVRLIPAFVVAAFLPALSKSLRNRHAALGILLLTGAAAQVHPGGCVVTSQRDEQSAAAAVEPARQS